jgi:hypothetical protein
MSASRGLVAANTMVAAPCWGVFFPLPGSMTGRPDSSISPVARRMACTWSAGIELPRRKK